MSICVVVVLAGVLWAVSRGRRKADSLVVEIAADQSKAVRTVRPGMFRLLIPSSHPIVSSEMGETRRLKTLDSIDS